MRRRTSILVLGAPLASLTLALAPAATAMTFAPCRADQGFSCATLSVPLDRGGSVTGTVALELERLQAGAAPAGAAVVALAGGPGQAALPLARQTATAVAPALGARDLVVFDQRGTGTSGPLACGALEGESALATLVQAFERCALQIGAARGSYTTQESVADIEAIRQAIGYRKLVLFGVSYGTKVALEYAERYPQNVEALLLDSVVPPERSDPFSVSMFKAMKPVFEELCSGRACAGIATNLLGDVARLAARLHKHALNGSVYDGSGRRHSSIMSDVDLLNLIGAGDLNPALRALLPASVQSALRGDPDPLLRLNLLSEGLVPNLPGTPTPVAAAADTQHGGAAPAWQPDASPSGIDEALFADTTCEEAAFPWQRSAPPGTRVAEAQAALRTLPGSDFYPFDASVEWADSVLPDCARWPNVAPAPPPSPPLPSVPTLILSGAQELRPPTAGGEAVAARIAGAQLVLVPHTGHSVIGADYSGCAQAAVKAFFAGGTALPCKATQNPFTPTPITPTKLSRVKPVGGVAGRAGSTLAVALDTIVDLERQVIGATLQAAQALPSGSSFGGLRGGYARISSSTLRLHRLSFVPGVQLSGTFTIVHGRLRPANLRVEGSRAARGTIRIGAPSVSGTLGGRRFSVNIAKLRLARADARGGRGTALDLRFPEPSLARLR
ncbi:MAG TPA: alpha/beta fold hydrolase [Solirubrobacteraceae bacterium]|nr:alpha/beta fold hydrolase [Solirubrobacteraceae bacterium]